MKNIMLLCLFSLSVAGPIRAAQEAVYAGMPSDAAAFLCEDSTVSPGRPEALPVSDGALWSPDGPGLRPLAFRDIPGELILSPDANMDVPADSTQADSLRHAMLRRLLPPHLSIVESGLWGENGLLRSPGLFGPLTPESRKSELSLRRTMLTMHQIGGFVTLGLMATTVYFGQMTLDHPGNRSYRGTHGDFVGATIASYSLTGALALLSPPPLVRRDEFSTTELHKILAWVHVVGMIVTPILGASLEHSLSYDQLARFHQISAYITTATFATAMIVVTF